MSVYEDNWYDVIVECRNCHDLHDDRIQLYSTREVTLVKELLDKLFTRCRNCGAGKEQFHITVSNEYFTGEEIRQMRKNKK